MKKLNLLLAACVCALAGIAQPPLGFQLPALPEKTVPLESPHSSALNPAAHLDSRTFIPPELADTLQAVLQDQQALLEATGLTAALRLPTGAVWSGGAGISEAGPDGAITPDHRSAIGSITKTIIAGVILDLYEEGLVALDETMDDWGIQYLYVNPEITIRQLLRHQSGVYNFTDHPSFSPTISSQPNIQYTPAAVLYQFLKPPLFDPGEQFSYSNSNYLLLAVVIEAATGNSFYEEVRSRFLDPLGLQSFFLPVLEPLQSPIAHLWLDLNGNGQLVDYHDEFFNWDALHTSTAAAGGYYSTTADLARWIYHSQSGSLFSPATMQEMHDFVSTTFPGNTVYGLGITRRNYVGYDGYGHGGDISYAASAYYFPELDVSVSVMDNDGTIISWDHAPVISRLLLAYDWYAANFPVPTTEPQATSLSCYPNPVNEELWIAGNTANCSYLEIFDAQGRRMLAFSSGQIPERLNTGQWSAGIYWLRWIEGGQVFQATVVRE